MALNTSRKDFITMRREVVAQLRARGLTVREIAEKLPTLDPPIIDHETGEPFSHVTIHTDCKANEKAWKAQAIKAVDEHKARQLLELTEAKREAWVVGDLKTWATLHALEVKLLGTAAPEKIAPTDPTGEKEYVGLTDEERSARVAALLEQARTRRARRAVGSDKPAS